MAPPGNLLGVSDLLSGSPSDSGALLNAATVVLLRDGDAGLECLMLHKTTGQAFGGAWVFPGGRVEVHDGSAMEGARQAAVRELAEETELRLGVDALVPLSHWTPPPEARRRYSTWFFVAGLPQDVEASDVVTDGGEISDHRWMTAAAALTVHHQGQLELLPPTWVTLHHLGRHVDVAAGLRDAAEQPVQRFATRFAHAGDVPVMLWDPDAAYPASQSDPPKPLDTPGPRHRLYMDPAGWRYERSS